MEVIQRGITIISAIVTVIGAATAINGGIHFFNGQKDSNPAEKTTGLNLFIAGAGIVIIAQTLIPMLGNMMSV